MELPTTNLSQRSGDSEQRHLSRVEEDSVEASSVKTQILQLGEVEVFIHFFLLVSICLSVLNFRTLWTADPNFVIWTDKLCIRSTNIREHFWSEL